MTTTIPPDVPTIHRMTIDEYLRAFESVPSRTELIDGVVYDMASQYSLHAHTIFDIAKRLESAVPSHVVLPQVAVRLDEHSVPEPDIVVITPGWDPYIMALVPVSVVVLLIEVSTTTQRFDLVAKQSLYARAGVPRYWVAEPVAGILHRFSQPADDAYGVHEQHDLATVDLAELFARD